MIKYQLKNLNDACYFRLRGTNQGLNVLGETDENGNPILDFALGANVSIKAINDLLFYSNPIFAVPTESNRKSGSIGSESEVNTVIESQEIGIYPNPAQDIIYFTNLKGESSVNIYSISGSLLSSIKIINNSANVSGLKKGVYIARIKDENKVSNVKFEIR